MRDAPRDFLPLSPQQFHILLSLTGEPCHGYSIIQAVRERTGGELQLGTGTLYTALARLASLALVVDTGKDDPRRRFYRLTPLGRKVLHAETTRLETMVRHAHESGIKGARRPAPAGSHS